MSIPQISFDEGEKILDWLKLTDALAAAHELPRAEIGDTFLYRRDDTLLTRSAWIDGLGVAVKAATIFPGNKAQGLPAVNGAVNLMSDSTGQLEAIVDFHLVTKWKTAGDSLLAARRLARPDSRVILIVGAGTVAASLREAYGAAFPNAEFLVWNRTPAGAEALAARYPGIEVVADLAEAVGRADIVTCATMSTEPVLKGEWLRAGQHVDLIGAYRPDMREADDTALERARIFVDSFDTTVGHIGEIQIPLDSGAITRDDLVADYYGLKDFIRAPEDITLFKNGGGAHLDLMVSRYIFDAWRAAQ
ncbi:ornithine cyclodeaminase [Pseudooceanicola antarcticus]|uniref:Ornithine cyclodeaminase n=1 Tax=Pseudooceanicola antarcticus TaxID=1247613 RepID=A0A285HJT6_9RHOB|nr:ornithine cyclodeaminase [Pseudooceanicola antarcticus]PJE27926.1 ornithine cyclodeaminase [Pseudooceanicola antarcticus]SNY35873.1 ornithine cyclodeaminase [Pseudooceanicola antarcticus]